MYGLAANEIIAHAFLKTVSSCNFEPGITRLIAQIVFEISSHELIENWDHNWTALCKSGCLSEDFINANWTYISHNSKCIQLLAKYQRLSAKMLYKFAELGHYFPSCSMNLHTPSFWEILSQNQHLPMDFIMQFQHKWDWNYICCYQNLSISFLEQNVSRINFLSVSQHQKLNEYFISKYANDLDWIALSKHQTMSQSFIHNNRYKVDWQYICTFQQLTESFIETHMKFVKWCWYCITKYQTVSATFLIKHLIHLTPQYCENIQKRPNLTAHEKQTVCKRILLLWLLRKKLHIK